MHSSDESVADSNWLGLARAEIRDFTTPNPAVYWIDYSLSMLIGYSAGVAYLVIPFGAWLSVALMIVAAVATYRAAIPPRTGAFSPR